MKTAHPENPAPDKNSPEAAPQQRNRSESMQFCYVQPFAGELADHILVERYKVCVSESKACDITSHAKKAFQEFGAVNPHSPNAKFFAVSSPGLEYIWGPLNHEDLVALRIRALDDSEPPRVRNGTLKTPDKVQAREIVKACGQIMQPEWHDLRTAVSIPRTHEILFQNIDLSSIPFGELFSPGVTDEMIVENIEEGFILKRERTGVSLHSRNEHILKALKACSRESGQVWQREELAGFLSSLKNSHWQISHFSSENSALKAHALVTAISSLPDGEWYVKHCRGSKGGNVAKLQVQNGIIVGIEFGAQSKPKFADQMSSVTEVFAEWIARGYVRRPILERAIPTEIIDGHRAEPRAFFERQDPPVYLCSYSKVAKNSALANGAQGGSLEYCRESFSRILASRKPDLDADALAQEVEGTFLRYKDIITRTARTFIAAAHEQGVSCEYVFAVDVAPIWNAESRQIDFMLIEVEAGPDTSGMDKYLDREDKNGFEDFAKRMEELRKARKGDVGDDDFFS